MGRPAYESTQPGESERVWSDPQSRLGRSPKLTNLQKQSCTHSSLLFSVLQPLACEGQMESWRPETARRNNCRSTCLCCALAIVARTGSLMSGDVKFGGEKADVFRVHVVQVQGTGTWGDFRWLKMSKLKNGYHRNSKMLNWASLEVHPVRGSYKTAFPIRQALLHFHNPSHQLPPSWLMTGLLPSQQNQGGLEPLIKVLALPHTSPLTSSQLALPPTGA